MCESITDGSCIDVNEFDAASESGVEEIREKIVQAVEYLPATARYKVFIIDEVHDLSSKAFDALLKTIEEPPEHMIFILATTEFNKVPPTIRSRCQKFEFHRASMQDLIGRLEFVAAEEGIESEPAALAAIARMADGGYRDALTLFEQARLSSDGPVTLHNVYDQLGLVGESTADELLLAMRGGHVEKIIEVSSELTRRGRDPVSVLESLLYRLSDLTRAAYGVETGDDAAREASLHEMSVKMGTREILAIRSDLAEAHKVVRDMSIPRLWMESELIRISQVLQRPVAPPSKEAEPVRAPAEKALAAPVVEPAKTKVAAEPAEAKPTAAKPAASPKSDAQVLWQAVLAKIPANAPMGFKLADSKAVALTESELTIELSGLVADWLQDKAERTAHLNKLLREAGGQVVLKFKATKSTKHLSPEASAVELPLEGKALHQAASEILRGQS